MNVASATSTVSRPFAFMTPRGSDAVDGGAGTRTPSSATRGQSADTGEASPLVNRFPTIAFSYDTDASRLVMLYRDPANGKTVSQIPTEAALKQYKEAQQQEKNSERAALLKLTVGGGQGGDGPENGRADGAGSPASALGTVANSIGGGKPPGGPTGSAGGVGSSAATASVSQSVSATAVSAGTSAARVNVVI
ncbi:hypothetical protein A6A40_20435 (plasmid) [Azospirillum humicireducens]|uniref:Uncharacterized protein n=1 Tax=Azospirillum humicireducens TaxID=1226968 RepID=A0A2R4VSK2_9PROT|nr:hypothetical protein [Azospirillum humicireducens]AWB07404.1 hypothetical protein A6A40_20435 [Azospirillum humicireducens]